jgi:chemotaxis protein CheD
LPSLYLSVNEGGVWGEPTAVRTVLGSCVCVVLFCARLGLGGAFHALLPLASQWGETIDGESPYRYVDTAIHRLHDLFAMRGAGRGAIQAKVFGGACSMGKGYDVGRRNVTQAFVTLESLGVRVAASSVGGSRGRKLIFRTDTGEVYMRFVRS